MTTPETNITNTHGIQFLIETAKDFDDNGKMVDGNGYFASIVENNDIHSGVWFETKERAVGACMAWEG